MNFSDAFRQSHQLCSFSPNGNFLASTRDYRLIVRDAGNLQITNLYTCLDSIQYIEWSADSQFILCGLFKRGVVQVWSVEVPDWRCKIDEGSAGLCRVCWGPDSRHILTTSDFYLCMTVWSLSTKSVSYIRHPKKCQKGLDFSRDGKHMVLAERRDGRDFVSIFDCRLWKLQKHFETETEDLAGVSMSPDQAVIAVWDTCLYYLILLYAPDGSRVWRYSAYDNALGIKAVTWSPTSQFLVVGSYDGNVRFLNNVTWRPVYIGRHADTVDADAENLVVYQEHTTRTPAVPTPDSSCDQFTGALFSGTSKYEVKAGMVPVPTTPPDLLKASPRLGVGHVSFSPDSKYMCCTNDSMRGTLWVWDVRTLSLCAVLIQDSPIKCIQWDPTQSRLALCTGTNKLFMWSPIGCLVVDVPVEGNFPIDSVTWKPDGGAVLVQGKQEFCVCYFTD